MYTKFSWETKNASQTENKTSTYVVLVVFLRSRLATRVKFFHRNAPSTPRLPIRCRRYYGAGVPVRNLPVENVRVNTIARARGIPKPTTGRTVSRGVSGKGTATSWAGYPYRGVTVGGSGVGDRIGVARKIENRLLAYQRVVDEAGRETGRSWPGNTLLPPPSCCRWSSPVGRSVGRSVGLQRVGVSAVRTRNVTRLSRVRRPVTRAKRPQRRRLLRGCVRAVRL